MSTQTNHKTDVKIPSQPRRGGDTPQGSPAPHRGRAALAVTTVVAAGVGVTALWIAVGSGTDSTAPSPGVETFVSEVPQGIDGSDWKLYRRGIERSAQALAQQQSASGSDQRLYDLPGADARIRSQQPPADGSDRRLLEQAAERAAQQQAQQESAFGSDRHLHNLAEQAR